MENSELDLTELTVQIVSAYVAHNTLVREHVSDLIGSVYGALNKVASRAAEPVKEELKPAVPIKKSITDDHIICLEDGKKFKSLKRHLRTHYDLSPEEYREKWSLPYDYPMVAPAYAAARSQMAKTMGLGQRRPAKAASRPSGASSATKSARTGSKGARPAPKRTRK